MIDTVPVKKSVAREPRPLGNAGSQQARYLVAEYLRDWGLRDPDILATESRRIVEQAEVMTLDALGTVTTRDLCATAIHLTMEEVEAAIANMAAGTTRDNGQAVNPNHSVMPHLAHVLNEFPDAIRHRDRPPARLLQVLERSVAPIIPRPVHREMPAQPSTRLLSLFRGCFWLAVYGRLQSWVCRCVGVN